jgi:DNA-binding phage protein
MALSKVNSDIGTKAFADSYDAGMRRSGLYRAYFEDGSTTEFHAVNMVRAQEDARFVADWTNRVLSSVAGL